MAPDTSNGPSKDPGGGPVDLAGVVLSDVRTGEPFDLGGGHSLVVLAVIRHRY